MKIHDYNVSAYQTHLQQLITLGVTNKPGEAGRALRRLRLLEGKAHRLAESYCNGDITEETLDQNLALISTGVRNVFNGQLPEGFMINTDPRGYALKIDDQVMREHYDRTMTDVLSFKDWGGYGILAPEF